MGSRSGPRRMPAEVLGRRPSRLAELVIGPATSGRTRWLAPQDDGNSACKWRKHTVRTARQNKWRKQTKDPHEQNSSERKTGPGGLCRALCGRERLAGEAVLRSFRFVAELPPQAVPAQRDVPRRCSRMPRGGARSHTTERAVASATGCSRRHAGQYRRARARGAPMHAARLIQSYKERSSGEDMTQRKCVPHSKPMNVQNSLRSARGERKLLAGWLRSP